MPRYDTTWLLNSGADFLDVYSTAFMLTHPTFSIFTMDNLTTWTADTPAVRGHLLVKRVTQADPKAIDWLSTMFGVELRSQLRAAQAVVVFANLIQPSLAALLVAGAEIEVLGPKLAKSAKSISLDQFTEMDFGQVFEVTLELLETLVGHLEAFDLLGDESLADEEDLQVDFDEALVSINWLLTLEDLI